MEEKIAKLFALAERTDNPAEAEAFTQKAMALMVQYGIEQAQVDAAKPGDKREPIVFEYIRMDHDYYQPLMFLGRYVGPAFNVKGFAFQAGNRKLSIGLAGHQSDVTRAAELIRTLIVQGEHAADYWWKTEGQKGLSAWKVFVQKREFMYAFAAGARDRLNEIHRQAKEEVSVGTDLVLRDRAALVEEWAKNNLGFGKGRGGAKSGGGYAATVAGREAGRNAVSQKAVR